MIDINSLTLGEVAKIEDLSGLPISAIADDDRPKGLALAALAFVAKRREDPKFSWNDAQALTMADVTELLDLDAEDDEDSDEGKDEASPVSVNR